MAWMSSQPASPLLLGRGLGQVLRVSWGLVTWNQVWMQNISEDGSDLMLNQGSLVFAASEETLGGLGFY